MEIEEQCSNCEKLIAAEKFSLHEAYCIRNNIKCQICKEVIQKSEMNEHQETHKKKPCQHCKKEFEQLGLEAHEPQCDQKKLECKFCLQMVLNQHQCKKIPKNCFYCNVSVPSDTYNDHIYMCGNKTEKCKYCQKLFPIKNINNHQQTCVEEGKKILNFEDHIMNDNKIPKQNIKKTDSFQQILKDKNKPTQNQQIPPVEKNTAAQQKNQPKPANLNNQPLQQKQDLDQKKVKQPIKQNKAQNNQEEFDIHQFLVKEKEEQKIFNNQIQRPIKNPFQNQPEEYHDFDDIDQGGQYTQNNIQYNQNDEDLELQRILEMSKQNYQQQFQEFPKNPDDDDEIQKAIYNSMKEHSHLNSQELQFQEAIKRSMLEK